MKADNLPTIDANAARKQLLELYLRMNNTYDTFPTDPQTVKEATDKFNYIAAMDKILTAMDHLKNITG